MNHGTNDSFEIEPQTPHRGMSGFVKFLLGTFLVGGVMLLLCCGGGYLFLKNRVQFVQDPAEIRALAGAIADIGIPADFKPEFGMKLSLGFNMKMAAYQAGPQSTLVLMQMNLPGAVEEDDLKARFDQQLDERGKKQDLVVKSREPRTYTIEGVERKFEVVTGTDAGVEVKEVRGVFPGKDGTAFMILRLPTSTWNDETVEGIISSIKTGAEPAAPDPASPEKETGEAKPEEK